MMKLNFVFNRAKNLIINPKAEWTIIQSELHSRNTIVNNYAVPLIALMSICSILGSLIMVSNLWYALLQSICIFVFAYIGIHISAVIINELTTSFNSKKDIDTTYKLVIYSFTACYFMLALALLWPPLSMLAVFSLFSIYLFWEGSTILLQTPEDNKTGFVVVSSLIIIGIYTILYLILKGILTSIFTVNFLG
jgi:hypothetical protein